MIADELPRPLDVSSGHADVVRFECSIEDDLALFMSLDDMHVWLVPSFVAGIDDDAKPLDFYARHDLNGNLHGVGLSIK